MTLSFYKRFLLVYCFLTINTAFAGGAETDTTLDNANFIKPYRAVYDAHFDAFLPFEGKAVRQLQQQKDGRWLLSHTIDSGIISLKETSLFDWQQEQPKTAFYQYKQKSIGKDRHEELKFDWEQQQAHHKTDEAPDSFAIPKNTLDKLTYQLKIRQDLLNGKEPSTYSVADKRRLKKYAFLVLGSEQLDTPVGKLNTLKIKRDRGADSERQTTLWLAEDWDYLLVKILQQKDGKDYEIIMVEGELDGKPIKGL